MEVQYRGRTIPIRTIQWETLSNDWVEFGVKSEDDTFLQVFGKNPIPLPVKPKQEFKTEFDFFQNTPEQVEIVREVWQAIQKKYY